MTDDELLGAISAAEETALGSVQGAISSDRADAIDRYYGKPYGDEQPGRSTVVSRDVADVVEGVVANVVKPFVGGDKVVQFEPFGPEDEDQAEQETDYVNFVALERNSGFVWLVSAIKDALLLRTGYVKCSWSVRSDVISETYIGQSEEEVALLLQDDGVEVVQHSEYPDPSMPMGAMDGQGLPLLPPAMLHDVKVRRTKPTEFVSIDPVPPNEILVSERSRCPSLQGVDFVQHRTRKSLSELRQAGYDVPDDISDSEVDSDIEDMARDRFGESGESFDDATGDAARRVVMYKESYLLIDRDGDGIAELRRVCQVGQTLLADEETEIVPIAAFSGVLVPHQHIGMSVYDLVEDLAKIKTALMRSYLDNRYLQNNGRAAVDVTRVNIDDFLVSRPGGVVRVEGDPSSAIVPIITPDTSSGALQGLEYLDSVRENRTGYTRNSAGIDNDALTNRTASGMSMQLSQSQMRLEMIARTIAETGIRDLFRIVHALTLKHSSKAEKIRLNGEWVAVNPREWVRRTDLSVVIGLGSGTTEQQLGKIVAMGPLLQELRGAGLVGVKEAYNYAQEVFKLSGYKTADRFVHAPQVDEQTGEPVEPPPQKPPQVQVEEMRLQADQQKTQALMQADQQKLQATQTADVQKFQAEQAASQAQAERDAALKREEMQMQLQVQAANDQRQSELDKQKMALDMHKIEKEYEFKVWLETAKMNQAAQLDQQRMAHESTTQRVVAKAAGVDVDSESTLKPVLEQMQALLAGLQAPKQVVRGADGRVVGVQTVQ
jgi:hypothetical protein